MASVGMRTALEEMTREGAFVRSDGVYREWVSEEHPVFKPESGRYHLYVSHACPWANRCTASVRVGQPSAPRQRELLEGG